MFLKKSIGTTRIETKAVVLGRKHPLLCSQGTHTTQRKSMKRTSRQDTFAKEKRKEEKEGRNNEGRERNEKRMEKVRGITKETPSNTCRGEMLSNKKITGAQTDCNRKKPSQQSERDVRGEGAGLGTVSSQ